MNIHPVNSRGKTSPPLLASLAGLILATALFLGPSCSRAGTSPASSGPVAGSANAPSIDPSASLSPAAAPGAVSPDDPAADQESGRKAVERLEKEQKFEAAAKEAGRVREEARRRGDQALWTWALVKEVQLRTALHGYETAVRFLKEEDWPDSPLHRDMLDLFYAQSLYTYYQAYSWEINRRERVEAAGPVDLKAWTRDQITEEAWKALTRVWQDRERLAGHTVREFPDLWEPGTYPSGVRDTLRDAVIYLMVRILTDTGLWTPVQSNEIHMLDLDELLAEAPPAAGKAAEAALTVLGSKDAHPLEMMAALLAEHESWCRQASPPRPEAALEARFELVSALYGAFTQEDDRALIRRRLASFLSSSGRNKLPWWAVGQALLAGFTRDEERTRRLDPGPDHGPGRGPAPSPVSRREALPPDRPDDRVPGLSRRGHAGRFHRPPLRPHHPPQPGSPLFPGLSLGRR
jgi:hypothetical protein